MRCPICDKRSYGPLWISRVWKCPRCGVSVRADRRLPVVTSLLHIVFLTVIFVLNLSYPLPQIRTALFVAYCLCVITASVMIFRRQLILAPPDGCIRCRYDLRGIDSDKCPECGTERKAE